MPKVHVEAPTSAIMLKLGGSGICRIMKSLNFFGFEILSDCKSLAAYSSICRMGFVLLLALISHHQMY
ncbi:hypothetical protein X798_01063 [Onchocerca flexuosa]|uniref:Uncharacterized protein n=1 Tax=Onchocerca flexuosa TaxID=387005 RepID=A0A238C334_9BILA|nr:hypothetical protein X798_01063 [Onchocerca flexuosa]